MTGLMNAHLLLRLLCIEDSLNTFTTYDELKRALNRLGSFEDFLKNFITKWEPSLGILSIFATEIGSLSHINTQSVLNREENMGEAETSVYLAPGRNRLKFFHAEKGRQRRLNQSANHETTSKPSKRCVACSNRTTNFCMYCQASMCKAQPPTGGRTCWERFHHDHFISFIERPTTSTKGRKGRQS
jgi:hypothetical protein